MTSPTPTGSGVPSFRNSRLPLADHDELGVAMTMGRMRHLARRKHRLVYFDKLTGRKSSVHNGTAPAAVCIVGHLHLVEAEDFGGCWRSVCRCAGRVLPGICLHRVSLGEKTCQGYKTRHCCTCVPAIHVHFCHSIPSLHSQSRCCSGRYDRDSTP